MAAEIVVQEPVKAHARPYVAVFAGLALLTAVEVYIAQLPIANRNLIIFGLVLFALMKAMLVALYFMHLKYERASLVVMAALPIPVGVLLAVVLLTI